MIALEVSTLLWTSLGTLAIYALAMRFLHSRNQKILYTLFTGFFFVYNGYGIAYDVGVYSGYTRMYFVFLATLSFSYIFFVYLIKKELRYAVKGTVGLLAQLFANRQFVNLTIGIYLLLTLFRLVYPEFRLSLLIHPPAPDILAEFSARYTSPPDRITKLVQALSYLIFPFYLIALSYYRNKLLVFTLLVSFPFYIQYCDQSYISRGEILAVFVIIFAMQWYYRKHIRKYLILCALALVPVLPILLVWYQGARSVTGDLNAELDTGTSTEYLIYSETAFPTLSDHVIRSGKQIDLKGYFIWIATLPIPKGIIGSVNPPSAGIEMSEILLGIPNGHRGFYALLAGLLTESAYIYGVRWYFIHAITIALLMAFIARLTENESLLFVIFIAIAIDLSYRLNRAGFAPALASTVNLYFSLYLLFFLGYLKRRWGLFRLSKGVAT